MTILYYLFYYVKNHNNQFGHQMFYETPKLNSWYIYNNWYFQYKCSIWDQLSSLLFIYGSHENIVNKFKPLIFGKQFLGFRVCSLIKWDESFLPMCIHTIKKNMVFIELQFALGILCLGFRAWDPRVWGLECRQMGWMFFPYVYSKHKRVYVHRIIICFGNLLFRV
jgi:hypothetical protein